MILIADSGSTKTSWVLIGDHQKKLEFQSQGFNPYVQTKDQISNALKTEVYPKVKVFDIVTIYFYGAGCSTPENVAIMNLCLKGHFQNADIEVSHDLMAAAKSLWHDERGIVAILGTGSNSCVFDGTRIIKSVPSLGYVLGDEGSGAYMGKKLILAYYYGLLPEGIHKKIIAKFSPETDGFLDHVYKMENPNRWLASFAAFISDNIKEEFCNNIVVSSFRDFFDAHIIHYKDFQDYPLGVVGSIGYYFRDQLEIVSKEYGFSLKKVIKSPMEELVNYHLQKEEK
jgi:glucosamine kinase